MVAKIESSDLLVATKTQSLVLRRICSLPDRPSNIFNQISSSFVMDYMICDLIVSMSTLERTFSNPQ